MHKPKHAMPDSLLYTLQTLANPYAQNVRCIVDRPSYLRSSATLSSASILKLRANGILDCKIHTLASKYVWYGLQLNQFKTAMLGIIGLIGAAAGALRTKLLVHGPRHSMLK